MKPKFLIKRHPEKKDLFVVEVLGSAVSLKCGMPEIFECIKEIREKHEGYNEIPIVISANVFDAVYACFPTPEEFE